MDATGQVYLVIAIVAVVGSIVVYWQLSRRAPRGTTLAVAALLYLLSYLIHPGRSRELVGLQGLLRFIGFLGIILGIVDRVRRPRDRTPGE